MDASTDLSPPLVGRDDQQARLARLVADVVVGDGPYLGVWGDPGSGKSALLEWLAPAEITVLKAAADAAETGVRAAVLHQLMVGLLHPGGGTARYPTLVAALSRAIADPESTAGAAAAAAAALLDVITDEVPTLLVVDDIDLSDAFSLDVLERLVAAPRRWGVLVAGRRRSVASSASGAHGATRTDVDLFPLDSDHSRRLVEVVAPQPGGDGRDQRRQELIDDIVVSAAGNPGVLVRLAQALIVPEVLQADSSFDILRRRNSALATLWLPRQPLSPEAVALGLVWAVASGYPGPPPVPVVPEQLVDDAPLAELLSTGLLVRGPSGVVPVHPLLPDAVLELTPSSEQRRAHTAVAGALAGGLRKAWHRAQSTAAADDVIADALERSVATAREHLAPQARARVFELAAAKSGHPVRRAARWTRAAEARLAGGDIAGTVTLLRRIEQGGTPRTPQVLLLEGVLASISRPPHEGYELLTEAAELARGLDDEVELSALASAAEVAWWSGRKEWAVQVANSTNAVAAEGCARITVEAIRGGAAVFTGDMHRAGRHLRAALDAGASATTAQEHRLAGQAALLFGDDLAATRHLAESVRLARLSGDVFQLAFTLQILAAVETWRGHLDRADELLTEGRSLIARTGDERSEAFERSMSAHIDGLRGAGEMTAEAARAALRLVTGRDVGFLPASALWALGRADLAAGRLASAFEYLEEVTDSTSMRAHPVAALFAIPDFVEAAVRGGRREDAEAALPRFEAWAEAGSPWAQSVLPRLRALVAPEEEIEQWFFSAGKDRARPFERARTQLLLGEHLRRSRQRVRARAVLEEAHTTFSALGTVPWAGRAAAELNATAERARRNSGSTTELTPQELTVARLVANGATNQQVAEQLFVSRKTVESHLHKVYTKLGIGSRKQLAETLPPET